MNRHDLDDRLAERLREAGRDECLDGGFTRRVMAALPISPRAPSRWRPWMVGGSAALGGLLACVAEGVGPAIVHGFADLARLQPGTPSAALALATVVALAAVAAALVAEEG
jgi:hypothetical protein